MKLRDYQGRDWNVCVPLVGQDRPSGCVRQLERNGGWERLGALGQVQSHWREGHHKVALIMPTGAGKTVVAREAAADWLEADEQNRVIFLVDRIDLVDQTDRTMVGKIDRVGWVWKGVREDRGARLQIVSIQSYEAAHGRWLLDWIGDPHLLIIIDEAHEAGKRSSIMPWLLNPAIESWFLLLTATPDRRNQKVKLGAVYDEWHGSKGAWKKAVGEKRVGDLVAWFRGLRIGKRVDEFWQKDKSGQTGRYVFRANETIDIQMGDFSDALAVGPTYRELIEIPDPGVTAAYRAHGFDLEMGSLVETKYLECYPQIVTTAIKTDGEGEFQAESAAVPAMAPEVLEGVVDAWEEHAWGLRTIAFCCTVKHAIAQGVAFASRGYAVGISTGKAGQTGFIQLDGSIKPATREQLKSGLRALGIDLLMSVRCGTIYKGWDETSVECIVDEAPLRSRGAWIQQVGRGKRVCPETGKTQCILLDFWGSRFEHGALEWIDEWKLPLGKPKGKRGVGNRKAGKKCPGCGALVPAMMDVCPECGYEWLQDVDGFKGFEIREAEDKGFLGPVGFRIRDVPTRIIYASSYDTEYGVRLLVAGIARGRRWNAWIAWTDAVVVGAELQLTGTVKEYGAYQKEPQTVLTRVKLEE